MNEKVYPYVPMMLDSRGVKEAVTKARFGRSITFEPYDNGDTLDCFKPSGVGFRAISRPKVFFRQTIARISAEDLGDLSYLPGDWKLSINGRPLPNPITGQFEASAAFPGTTLIAPLVAIVTFGTGAASHEVELDAVGSTIALPALDVTVDVGISQVCGLSAPSGNTLGLFSLYQVEAVLHKSTTGKTQATRSILNSQALPTFPIYPFASSWCYVPILPLASGTLIGGAFAFTGASGEQLPNVNPVPAQVESVAADLVANMARMHCFRPLHPLAHSVDLNLFGTVPPDADFMGAFVQKLEF